MLIHSAKFNMPSIPFAVVTDSCELDRLADVVIAPDQNVPPSTAQKLLLDLYTPFDETLFIDSDCIVARPFYAELEEIRRFDFTPIIERVIGPDGSDEYIRDLRVALAAVGGVTYPKFNGGVYYMRKSKLATAVLTAARAYRRRAEELGLVPFDAGGAGDETAIGLALSSLRVEKLYRDGGRLMRTPTDYSGTLYIEPLGGGCSFRRPEGEVNPAICHFAGPYLRTPEYYLASLSVTTQRPVSRLPYSAKLYAYLWSAAQNATTFLMYKYSGAKKRIANMFSRPRYVQTE